MRMHMKNLFKLLIKVVLSFLLIVLIVLGGFITYAFITDYKPEARIQLEIDQGTLKSTISTGKPYSILTYNIGYGALGKDQDFFMDGGSKAGADSYDEVITNMESINQFFITQNPDFAFFQEVDLSGNRGFDVNQYEFLRKDEYNGVYAPNYKVKYVPVPFTHPMGGAESGIVTLSKSVPNLSERYRFEGEEPMIKQLFDLKRAFSITRYPTDNGKELVLINAHFSAFDEGGKVRVQQLAQMRNVLETEYEQGNYVILGGDFNHELPTTDAQDFTWTDTYPDWIMKLPEDFAPQGYHWGVDPTNPSVRAVDKAYRPQETFTAVIDGFLVSDNIEITQTKGHGTLNFEHSDHNPVTMIFTLK